jgi:hypothetical protein
MESVLYDAAGHRRSPVTMPGYHQGRPPRNEGLRYPADPPAVEEIIAVMRAGATDPRALGCVPSSFFCGALGFGSTQRSSWPRPILTPRAVQSSFARERVARVRRRFAPHQLRHAHAIEMAHEGVPLVVIQRPSRRFTPDRPP